MAAVLEKFDTGVAGLDDVLAGGLYRGSLYIIEGEPGAGKTTVANQIAYRRAEAGETVVYGTLLAESADRMLAYISSMSFADPGRVARQISYVSFYNSLASAGVPGLLDDVRDAIRRLRPSVLILDGLLVAAERSETAFAYREFIHVIQGEAQVNDCTVFFVNNGSESPYSPERTMVDGIIRLGTVSSRARKAKTLEVMKLRGADYLTGLHFLTIGKNGVRVWPRLETVTAGEPDPLPEGTVSSGNSGLDSLFGGGLPAASNTLVVGPSGSGKTSLGLSFLRFCSPGEPGLLISFYEKSSVLERKAARLGLKLEDPLDKGGLKVVWMRPAEKTIDEVCHRILEEIDALGARRVFVDGATALRLLALFPERLTGVLRSFAESLSARGVTAMFTLETRDLFSPEMPQIEDLSAISDNILLLRLRDTGQTLLRSACVVKVRDGSFRPDVVPYSLTDQGLVIEPGPTA